MEEVGEPPAQNPAGRRHMGPVLRLPRRPQHIGGVLLRAEVGGRLPRRPTHGEGAGVHPVQGRRPQSASLHQDMAGALRPVGLEIRADAPARDGAAAFMGAHEPLRLRQLGQGYHAAPEHRADSQTDAQDTGQRRHPRTHSERRGGTCRFPQTQGHGGSGRSVPPG